MNQQDQYRHQNPIESTPVSSKHTIIESNSNRNTPTMDEHRNRLNRTTARHTNKTILEDQHSTAAREQRRAGHNCHPTPTPYKKQRRPSQAMCTLKTELATLKEEIGKLMTLDGKLREDEQRGQSFGNYSTRNSRKLGADRETASMSHSVLYKTNHNDLSFLLKEEETPSNEKVHYILLENESLKLELKNLKIRYVQRKAQLKDEIHCLQLKVNSLEAMLEHGGDSKTGRSATTILGDRESNHALIESLKQEINRLRADDFATKLSVQSKQHEKELADKQATLNSLKVELDRLHKAFEGKEHRIRELESTVQNLDTRRNEHVKLSEQHYKRELDNALRQRDGQLEVLSKERNQLAQVVQAREQQLRELSGSQSTIQQQLQSLRKELHNKDLMLSQMDYEKRLMTENNRGRVDQLEKLIESLKQELQVSEAKLGEASRIIQNQQQEIGNFVNHHTDSRAVENALRAEMERLQNIIAAKEAEYKHQLTIFSNENIQLVQVADQLSARVRALEGSLESVHHAMKTAEAENNNLRQTIGNLTTHIETINSSHQQSEKVTQALNHSAKHYEEKIAQLRTDYEQHIQKLANSSSEAHKMIDQLNLRLKQKEGEVGQLKYQLERAHKVAEEVSANSRKASSDQEELESQIQTKQQEIQKLKEVTNGLKLQLESLRSDNLRQSEELYRMGSLSDRSQQQSSLLREQEAIIEHLQQKIAKLEGSLEALNKEIANHLSNLQRLDNIIKDKERAINKKDEQIASANVAIRQKVAELNDERDRWRRADRTSDQSKVITALENQLKQQAHDYDEIILGLKHELQHRHRDDLSRSRSSLGDIGSLDEAMKGRDEEIKTLRESLCQRNLEVERLQSLMSKSKSELDNLKRQYGVDRVRSISERNSSQTVIEIEIMNLKSDLNLERKTNESAMQKLKYLNEESRKKDSFIQNFLIGKKLGSQDQVDLKEFFANYEKEFPRETIHTRLFSEVKELQQLTERVKFLESQLSRVGILPTAANSE